MNADSAARPDLTADLAEAEFVRWYWLKDELASFARLHGIRATGGSQLSGVLSAATVIPVGQRSSQVVRAWMA